MFKKNNLLKNLIALIVLMILGAIVIALALDPNAGIINKKEKNNNIMYANDVAQ